MSTRSRALFVLALFCVAVVVTSRVQQLLSAQATNRPLSILDQLSTVLSGKPQPAKGTPSPLAPLVSPPTRGPAFPQGAIVADDRGREFRQQWVPVGAGFRGGSVRLSEDVRSGDTFRGTWDFSKRTNPPSPVPAGEYDVYVTWVSGADLADDVNYQVLDAASGAVLADVQPLLSENVNQKNDPNGPQHGEGNRPWQKLGTVTIENGFVNVIIHSTVAWIPFDADAVMLVPLPHSSSSVSSEAASSEPIGEWQNCPAGTICPVGLDGNQCYRMAIDCYQGTVVCDQGICGAGACTGKCCRCVHDGSGTPAPQPTQRETPPPEATPPPPAASSARPAPTGWTGCPNGYVCPVKQDGSKIGPPAGCTITRSDRRCGNSQFNGVCQKFVCP
jgi:hypothetical protein